MGRVRVVVEGHGGGTMMEPCCCFRRRGGLFGFPCSFLKHTLSFLSFSFGSFLGVSL